MSSVGVLFNKMELSNDQVEKPTIVQQWISKHESKLSSVINGRATGDTKAAKVENIETPSKIKYSATCASSELLNEAVKQSKGAQQAWQEKDSQAKTRILYAIARTFQKHVNLFATSEAVTYPFKRVEKCRGTYASYTIEYLYKAASRRNSELRPPRCAAMIVTHSPKCSPMNLVAEWKIFEALTSDTPVILVVSPSNCIPALVLAEICNVSGLPPNLLNVVILSESQIELFKCPSGLMHLALKENRPHLSSCVIIEGADHHSAVSGAIEMLADCWGSPNYHGLSLFVHECIGSDVIKILEAQVKNLKLATSNFAKTVDIVSGESVEIVKVPHVTNEHISSNPKIFVQTFRTLKEASSLVSCGVLRCESLAVWTEYVGLAVEFANRVCGFNNVWINGQNLFDIELDSLKELQYPSGEEESHVKLHHTVPPIPDISVEHIPHNIDRTLKLYYGGSQKRPESNSSYAVFYKYPPFDRGDKIIAYAPFAGPKDVRNAVEAAVKAFPGWRNKSAFNRSQIMYFFGENLSQRRTELQEKLSFNIGHSDCEAELQDCIDTAFKWAGYCDTTAPSFTSTSGLKVFSSIEPLGVIGIVCPSVKSMSSLITLLTSAVSIGNTVVLIVPEEYPVAPLMLAQVIETSDIPAGVINILSGPTEELLLTLSKHHDVSAIWSWSARKTEQAVAACNASGKNKTWWFNVSSVKPHVWDDNELDFYRASRKYVWLPCSSVYSN